MASETISFSPPGACNLEGTETIGWQIEAQEGLQILILVPRKTARYGLSAYTKTQELENPKFMC
jgi:hypothetical protein